MSKFTDSDIDDDMTAKLVMEISRRLTGGTADTQQAAEAALIADGFEGMTIEGSEDEQ